MTKKNNLVLSYLIIKKFNDIYKKSISPLLLINYIIRRTAVTKERAKEYIHILENGILIENKVYQIEYKNGGYYARQ